MIVISATFARGSSLSSFPAATKHLASLQVERRSSRFIRAQHVKEKRERGTISCKLLQCCMITEGLLSIMDRWNSMLIHCYIFSGVTFLIRFVVN